MAYAPTLTVSTDAEPMPRVEVLFESFAAGTAFVDVYRLAAGREYKVRAGVKAATAGALSRIDFEAPFGTPVTYRAEMFNASLVSLGFTDTTSTILQVEETWVHNPLNPGGGVQVTMADTAAARLSRPVDGATFRPEGRRTAVVIAGDRGGLQGVSLDCYTLTDADTELFANLVGGYDTTTVPVLCFRIPASTKMRLPRPLFAVVFDPAEIALDLNEGGESMFWETVGDEAAPPTPALVVPLLTRADIDAAYATRAAVRADNLTRLSVSRRYEFAGSA